MEKLSARWPVAIVTVPRADDDFRVVLAAVQALAAPQARDVVWGSPVADAVVFGLCPALARFDFVGRLVDLHLQ